MAISAIAPLTLAEVTSGFRDPSFGHNRQRPIHRWVPWVAGFSAQFVSDCIDTYLPAEKRSKAWVLDPFSGVGTTLVEAYLKGVNVIGFEINPYAVLALKAKLEAAKVPIKTLADRLSQFEKFMFRNSSVGAPTFISPKAQPPSGFSGRTELFSPKVERKVLFAQDFISTIKDKAVRDLFLLAFGSVMISFSNYTYEPSLTRRTAVGKSPIHDADVAGIISKKLLLMLEDIVELQDTVRSIGRKPKYKIYPSSFFEARTKLPKGIKVDLVITSPPYLNNYHYPRNTRPQIHWLGLGKGKGYAAAGESHSFGKFWQTVRDLPQVNLAFRLPELTEVAEAVRKRNNYKNQYGGAGWANYIVTYFNDTYRFCQILKPLLSKGGRAVVVLGNSIIQGVEVSTDQFFGDIAELCGMHFEKTILLRNKRTGSSIIQSSVRVDKANQRTVLYESAIILRKK